MQEIRDFFKGIFGTQANLELCLLFAGAAIVSVLYARRKRWLFETLREDYHRMTSRVDERGFRLLRSAGRRERGVSLADTIEAKRQSFLNVPNISFHYVDKGRVTNFYNDYFKEPTIEKMVDEVLSDVSGGVKTGLPKVVEVGAKGREVGRLIKTMKLPDTSLSGMMLRYQRQTIANDQVTLGLEDVDVELTELDDFNMIVESLNTDFKVALSGDLLEPKRSEIKEKAAERTMERLEKAAGAVLIEGKFLISLEGDSYKCSYTHPVTEYMRDKSHPVTINIFIPRNAIQDHVAGNYAQSVGTRIPLRIYGHVWQPISRFDSIYNLTITPLAVYC